MRATYFLAALAAATVLTGRAADIAGDWQGTLKPAPGAQFHLVVHISKTNDGGLNATIASLDQDAPAISVSAIAIQDSKLTFTSDEVHGSYQGTVNADASAIEGTWTQGQPFPLKFTRAVRPSDIDGTWEGTLDAGQKLRLVVHLTTTRDGLEATLDSPDQGASGIAASGVKREGAALSVEIARIGGKFQGAIAKGLTTIDGTFSQGGGSFPLILKRKSL